ncbi:ABC transporter substrate-binding protein [Pseudoxanthomonas helianthi]|uniref:ABC transporter substrate-binding protein n=1 Tax=Pseudoxanthomonas helianthi TaxID=1453541 RepID=A0A940X3V3_9GAMM|nr:ABC transporter substrate-binding protein [Pseudoxanthomonas helianthi]MBP3983863.1 ABC transporter substrate-binding protein [Pseudoxanthomonas helianthi]
MKLRLTSLALASALLAGAPVLAQAQAAQPARTAAPAAQGSASKLVLDSSSRIIGTLESRRAEFRKNPTALRQYVDTEFNRVFDRDYAARLVLGVHGRGAPDSDIKLFADAMADNLMSRYGSSLLDFNSKLRVRVKSETPLPGGRGVKVASELLRSDGEPVPIDYLMRNSGGQWKVFDVMIEGISYVQTFKNQFDAPLRTKSIAQVAADLRKGTLQAGGN